MVKQTVFPNLANQGKIGFYFFVVDKPGNITKANYHVYSMLSPSVSLILDISMSSLVKGYLL